MNVRGRKSGKYRNRVIGIAHTQTHKIADISTSYFCNVFHIHTHRHARVLCQCIFSPIFHSYNCMRFSATCSFPLFLLCALNFVNSRSRSRSFSQRLNSTHIYVWTISMHLLYFVCIAFLSSQSLVRCINRYAKAYPYIFSANILFTCTNV